MERFIFGTIEFIVVFLVIILEQRIQASYPFFRQFFILYFIYQFIFWASEFYNFWRKSACTSTLNPEVWWKHLVHTRSNICVDNLAILVWLKKVRICEVIWDHAESVFGTDKSSKSSCVYVNVTCKAHIISSVFTLPFALLFPPA